jgi:ketosteroid isomerase-like protein
MRIMIAAALLAAASPVRAETAALSGGAAEAAAVVDSFHAALHRGDTRAAASLVAGDALIFESGGAEHSRAEYEAHHLPADADFSKSVTTSVKRRTGGSDGAVAWIATEGAYRGTHHGKSFDQVTTETMVLRRTAEGWKIVHIHWSSAPAH